MTRLLLSVTILYVCVTSVIAQPKTNPHDVYPPERNAKPLYVNIIWHQHQPLYVNPERDELTGPWVRTHATKDYYDMAAMLKEYPDVHCTINLTSSLLHQLLHYYVDRLGPFVDTKTNTIDDKGFLRAWKGKTDPWIDLALRPPSPYTHAEKDLIYRNPWNAFGISDVMIDRFPEYRALRGKKVAGLSDELYTADELRDIVDWFFLAYFDPDFFRGPVKLPDGSVCDLSGYLDFNSADNTFHLKRHFTDADGRRLVVEAYKVMKNVIPAHAQLRYEPATGKGQVEIITTPYYHPILPLIFDSDLARVCQPNDSLPPRFSYPEDAAAQVAKAVKMYTTIFGAPPTGMWPGEGSLAQPVLATLRNAGIVWSASDVKVLDRSLPSHQPNTTPYTFPAGSHGPIALVFRDTDLSDRIGFTYQNLPGEAGAEDFVSTILQRTPQMNDPDRLLTVILDGENAWEWYRKDIDGKDFLHALYRKLSKLYADRRVITTTPTEYMAGNPARGIAPHPVTTLPALTRLWPGSWINANYDTWIGEKEENTAWRYLLQVRRDLGSSGIAAPDPMADEPARDSKRWFAWKAWEEMYAAEGSDWFWWYGDDQTAPGGDKPFDTAYLTHLKNVYAFARKAGASITWPGLAPIIPDNNSSSGSNAGGTMAREKK